MDNLGAFQAQIMDKASQKLHKSRVIKVKSKSNII